MLKPRHVIPAFWLALFLLLACRPDPKNGAEQFIGGIYPHLAVYNSQNECGIGAVVPWAGKPWAVT